MKIPLAKKFAAALLATTMLVTPLLQVSAELTDAEREDLRKAAASGSTAATTSGSTTSGTTTSSGSNSFTPSTKWPFADVQKKVQESKKTNKDVVGWLRVPNINIDEPITFSNANNSYYVARDWKGVNYPNNNYQNFAHTATYADYRTKWGETWRSSSRNIVLYGHNWTNLREPLAIGSNNNHVMFGQLPSFTNLEFASKTPYVYFSTGENEGVWKVFAVAYCELSTSFNYNKPNPSKEELGKLVKEWQSRSMYDYSVEVDSNDRILTLSTCTRQFGSHENQRFVVVARLLRDGESDKQKVTVTKNEDMKKPKL